MCHASWLCFRYYRYCRKIPPLRDALRSGYNPRKKTLGLPPLATARFLNAARHFLGHNLTDSGRKKKIKK